MGEVNCAFHLLYFCAVAHLLASVITSSTRSAYLLLCREFLASNSMRHCHLPHAQLASAMSASTITALILTFDPVDLIDVKIVFRSFWRVAADLGCLDYVPTAHMK
jgi:hypothetical protein